MGDSKELPKVEGFTVTEEIVSSGRFLELHEGDSVPIEFQGYGRYQKYEAPTGEMEDRPEVVRLDTGETGVLRAWVGLMNRLRGANAKPGDKFLLKIGREEKGKGGKRWIQVQVFRITAKATR